VAQVLHGDLAGEAHLGHLPGGSGTRPPRARCHPGRYPDVRNPRPPRPCGTPRDGTSALSHSLRRFQRSAPGIDRRHLPIGGKARTAYGRGSDGSRSRRGVSGDALDGRGPGAALRRERLRPAFGRSVTGELTGTGTSGRQPREDCRRLDRQRVGGAAAVERGFPG
jgi:hypothetical protein